MNSQIIVDYLFIYIILQKKQLFWEKLVKLLGGREAPAL